MANQYPSASTTVTTDSSGRTSTAVQTFSYASPVVAKTANYQVQASDSGTIFTTTGAGGAVQFTLPTASSGQQFTFVASAAFTMTVVGGTFKGSANGGGALTGTTITVNAGTLANQYTRVTVLTDGTTWFITDIQGVAGVS